MKELKKDDLSDARKAHETALRVVDDLIEALEIEEEGLQEDPAAPQELKSKEKIIRGLREKLKTAREKVVETEKKVKEEQEKAAREKEPGVDIKKEAIAEAEEAIKTIREILEEGELSVKASKKELDRAMKDLAEAKKKPEGQIRKDAVSDAKKRWEESVRALDDEAEKWENEVGHRGGEGVGGDAWHQERESALAKLVVKRDRLFDVWMNTDKKDKATRNKEPGGQIKKLQNENANLSKKLDALESQILKGDLEQRIATDYSRLSLDPDNFVKALADIQISCSSDTFDEIHKIFKSCNDKMDLTPVTKGDAGAWDKIEELASEIRKKDSSLSVEVSINKAINDNPELYVEYQKEAN